MRAVELDMFYTIHNLAFYRSIILAKHTANWNLPTGTVGRIKIVLKRAFLFEQTHAHVL